MGILKPRNPGCVLIAIILILIGALMVVEPKTRWIEGVYSTIDKFAKDFFRDWASQDIGLLFGGISLLIIGVFFFLMRNADLDEGPEL